MFSSLIIARMYDMKFTMSEHEGLPMNDRIPNDVPIKSVRTAACVLDGLLRLEDPGVTTLAAELSLSKGAVYKHLQTLEALGIVTATDGQYAVGYGLLGPANAPLRTNPVYQAARSPLANLAVTTGTAVTLYARTGGHLTAVDQWRGSPDLDPPVDTGCRAPLHATAAGKAVLASLPAEAVSSTLGPGQLKSMTPRTETDRRALLEQLHRISERRVAFDRGEFEPDWHCVGTTVEPSGTEQPDGTWAFSAGNATRALQGKGLEEDVLGLVISARNRIEVSLLSSSP